MDLEELKKLLRENAITIAYFLNFFKDVCVTKLALANNPKITGKLKS